MPPASQISQVIRQPYTAFAVGMGLFVFGLMLYEAVDDEEMTRETVEAYADETREVGGGVVARLWEEADSLDRDDPDEDTSLGPAAALATGVVGGVLVTGVLLRARPYLQAYTRWNLRFARRHLPDALTGHTLYGEFTTLVRTEFGSVFVGCALLVVVWLVYGQVSLVLLEEYA